MAMTKDGVTVYARFNQPGLRSEVRSQPTPNGILYHHAVQDEVASVMEHAELIDYQVKESRGFQYRLYSSYRIHDLTLFLARHDAAVTTWTDLFMIDTDDPVAAGELFANNLREYTSKNGDARE